MRTTLACMILALVTSALRAAEVEPQKWDFEDAPLGQVPPDWTAAKTGDGEGSVCKVVEDKSSPDGARVLAQVSKGPGPLFNLCLADGTKVQDLELSVEFRAVDGKVDQGGGLVWRYADANNYYVARFNPLEDNFRLYKFVGGKRTQLATKEEVKAPAGEWQKLAVRMQGDTITCTLNGKTRLETKDSTLPYAGQIGLWTKADAQTYFDEIEVAPLK